ncbi:RNA polymerase sigma factor SigY [Gorillibacterium massiliense]|uniref:RNA polymerase sigma factor SigY n=1 Tax=Gorillibacterium massiliense TaxID=1280390 RepID=UPI0004B2EC7F|nr:RNA polymerase sigma factor SigY [Gorillibacterium massiliense]
MDEQDLVKRAKGGDTKSLSELLSANYSFLLKYLAKVTMNPNAAEDLAQETMLKAVDRIRQFDGRAKFSSWLIAVATRVYLDAQRRKKREWIWLEKEKRRMSEPSPESMKWRLTAAGGEWSDVLDALSRMPEETRMPVVLKHYYGFTQREIADMMDIPEGTVKSRIHAGLSHLRKELTLHEPEKEPDIRLRDAKSR